MKSSRLSAQDSKNYEKGKALFHAGKYGQALDAYNAIEKKDDFYSQLWIAKCQIRLNKFEIAREVLEKLEKNYVSNISELHHAILYNQLSHCYSELYRKYGEENYLNLQERTVKKIKDQTSFEAKFCWSSYYFNIGEYEKSLELVEYVLANEKLDANREIAIKNFQAIILGRVGPQNNEVVFSDLKTIVTGIDYSPLKLSTYKILAHCDAEFVQKHTSSIEIRDETNAYELAENALVCEKMGKYREAQDNYERSIALDPYHWQTRLNYCGFLHKKLKEYDSTIAILLPIVEYDESTLPLNAVPPTTRELVNAYLALEIAYNEVKQPENAKNCNAMACELDPDRNDLDNTKAKYHYLKKQREEYNKREKDLNWANRHPLPRNFEPKIDYVKSEQKNQTQSEVVKQQKTEIVYRPAPKKQFTILGTVHSKRNLDQPKPAWKNQPSIKSSLAEIMKEEELSTNSQPVEKFYSEVKSKKSLEVYVKQDRIVLRCNETPTNNNSIESEKSSFVTSSNISVNATQDIEKPQSETPQNNLENQKPEKFECPQILSNTNEVATQADSLKPNNMNVQKNSSYCGCRLFAVATITACAATLYLTKTFSNN